jgi:phosphatidylserine decarboxylase
MAKEGIKFLFLFLLIAFLCLFSFKWLSIPFFLLSAFCIYFFRDPVRKTPEGKEYIVSPADGKVIEIEEIPEKNLKKISIFMSLFDVHVNRIPYDGKVKKITYKKGSFNPAHKNSSSENEQNIIEMETDDGWDYKLVQVAGILARRIVCRIKEGDIVKKGEKFGLIMFGSRVDLYIPKNFLINVKKGEKVKGGETIIGKTA